MTEIEKLAKQIHQITLEDGQSMKRIDPIFNSSNDDFKKALLYMISMDDGYQKCAFYMARNYGIQFPVELLRNLFKNCDEARRESIAKHCGHNRIKGLVPEFEEAIREESGLRYVVSAMIEALIDIGEPSSKEVLESVYQKFDDRPLIRGKYEELLAKWGQKGEIRPLPEKTIGIYARSGVGTNVPESGLEAPSCPSCNSNMICLFQVPREADIEVIPIFHCLRCVFHQPIFLQEVKGGFRWLREAVGEELEEDELEIVTGGVIVWGVGDPERSKTFLGGSPYWAQSETQLICPCCNTEMSFILQLESDFSLGINLLYFYHGGIMYVFRCKNCAVTGYFFQTT